MFDHEVILSQIQELYSQDSIPWVIGFSGGKDSTTVLQMLFYALSALPKQELSKPIHVLQQACVVYAQLMGYIVNGTKSNHILSLKELGQLFVRWDNPPGGPIALAAAILALSLPFRQAARRRLRKLLATLSAQFREHLSLPKSGAPSGLAVLLSDSTSLSHWGHEKTNPPFWYSRPTRMIIPCS